MGVKGAHIQTIKEIYEKPIANIILKRKTIKSFPTNIRNKTTMSVSPLLFNKVLANHIQQYVKKITHHDKMRFISGMKE